MSASQILVLMLVQKILIFSFLFFSFGHSISNILENLYYLFFLGIADVKAMCKSDPTRCETYAICDTLQGALNCRCKRGFFVKHRECSGEILVVSQK